MTMIETKPNYFDIRNIDRNLAVGAFKASIKQMEWHDSMWLIDDHESLDCYQVLLKHDLKFKTYVVNPNEYRTFISFY